MVGHPRLLNSASIIRRAFSSLIISMQCLLRQVPRRRHRPTATPRRSNCIRFELVPAWQRRPQGRHDFSLEAIPGVLVPPAVFGGLLVALWTYKCLMMVTFQNKIIYMPGVPPFSRSEKVEDYAAQCRPVIWSEHDLKARDGTKLKLLEGVLTKSETRSEPKLVVLYFQGYMLSLSW